MDPGFRLDEDRLALLNGDPPHNHTRPLDFKFVPDSVKKKWNKFRHGDEDGSLKAIVEDLKKEIQSLRKQVAELKGENAEVQEEVEELEENEQMSSSDDEEYDSDESYEDPRDGDDWVCPKCNARWHDGRVWK